MNSYRSTDSWASARPGEVKRLGDNPVVIEFESNGARIEVAARAEQRALAIGPLEAPANVS